MPILSAQDLQKSFGSKPILEDATLTLRTGEKVGLVGVNGSGKSTLARVLAGLEPLDAGLVTRRRGARVLYLAQEPVFERDEPAHDVVLSGLSAWSRAKARYEQVTAELAGKPHDWEALTTQQSDAAADLEREGGWDRMHQVEAILGHLGATATDVPVRSLSGGEQRRVALARLLIARPDLAIFDEPTNHLDVETIEWLERYLENDFGGAFLLITHDRYLLDRTVDRILELDAGRIYTYEGGYGQYLEGKAERLAHGERVERNRQNFLRTELEWLSRQPKARGTKQKARIERAEEARETPKLAARRAAVLSLEATRSGKSILEFRGLGLTVGSTDLVRSIDWTLVQGERVGILGRNGTGKTTLLRAIVGQVAPSRGEVVLGKNTKVAYFDQLRSSLDPEASVFDNVIQDHPNIEIGGHTINPHSYLERFLFDGSKQRQPVRALSGGERARVALAKMLAASANLVILDEPTNDLDVATLGALEQMLIEFGGTAMVVTHDRWFLDRVATSILAFEGDGRVVGYAGNYSTYVRLREEREAVEQEREKGKEKGKGKVKDRDGDRGRDIDRDIGRDKDGDRDKGKENSKDKTQGPPSERTKEKGPVARSKGLTFAERKELEGILDRIEAADAEVSRLTKMLEDPAFYAGGGLEVKGTLAKLDAAREAASSLMRRWEDLEAKRGSQ